MPVLRAVVHAAAMLQPGRRGAGGSSPPRARINSRLASIAGGPAGGPATNPAERAARGRAALTPAGPRALAACGPGLPARGAGGRACGPRFERRAGRRVPLGAAGGRGRGGARGAAAQRGLQLRERRRRQRLRRVQVAAGGARGAAQVQQMLPQPCVLALAPPRRAGAERGAQCNRLALALSPVSLWALEAQSAGTAGSCSAPTVTDSTVHTRNNGQTAREAAQRASQQHRRAHL